MRLHHTAFSDYDFPLDLTGSKNVLFKVSAELTRFVVILIAMNSGYNFLLVRYKKYAFPQQQEGYSDYGSYDSQSTSRIKDLEEKQNLLKDRLLLIGHNLIETKEEDSKKITELKKDVEGLKEEIRKMKNFLEMVSEELSKFARREDLEILAKQAKMFKPLDLIKRANKNT